MKIIFIYGPPAVGKLPVAKELSKITKYKLFHNHLIGDLLNSLLEFNSKNYKKYSLKFRLDMLKAANEEGVEGVIMTFMYDKPYGNQYIKKIIERVKKDNASIKFVQLICSEDDLRRRVISESRKKFTKVSNIKGLNESLKKWDLLSPIPFVKSLIIDNTNLSAKKAAQKIKKELNIK